MRPHAATSGFPSSMWRAVVVVHYPTMTKQQCVCGFCPIPLNTSEWGETWKNQKPLKKHPRQLSFLNHLFQKHLFPFSCDALILVFDVIFSLTIIHCLFFCFTPSRGQSKFLFSNRLRTILHETKLTTSWTQHFPFTPQKLISDFNYYRALMYS